MGLPAPPLQHPLAPNPSVAHRRLGAPGKKLRGKKRIVVVGDVHGCCEPLHCLVRKITFEQETDLVLLTGDLAGKGPESPRVVRFCRQKDFFSIRGNHDDAWLAAKIGTADSVLSAADHHAEICGVDPDDFASLPPSDGRYLSHEDWQWLLSNPYTLTVEPIPLTIVHAGLLPGRPLKAQRVNDLLTMRDVALNSEALYDACPAVGSDRCSAESMPWASVWVGPEFVCFGHDAKRKLQRYPYALGLDTGCCLGDRLSCLIVPIEQSFPRVEGRLIGRVVSYDVGEKLEPVQGDAEDDADDDTT